MFKFNESVTRLIPGCAIAAALLAGCAKTTESSVMSSGTAVTASDQNRMTQSGFLSDYKRL